MAIYKSRIGTYEIVLTINTQSQSQTNNTSTLSYNLRVDKLSGYGYWTSMGQPYSININGKTVKSGTWTYNFNNFSSKTIDSGTVTINHNSNGSITIPVAATVSMYSIGTGYISSTYTPLKIYRSIDSFTFYYGWSSTTGNKQITFTKPNSNIRAHLEWKYYNGKNLGWSNTRVVSTDYTSQTSFKFSDEDINLMHAQNPNNQYVTLQFVLKSYSGSVLTKTITKNIELKLKEEPPIINSTFEVRGQNQNLLASSNLAVQNIHWLKIIDDVKANNGASISRIEVEFEKSKQSSSNAEFKITKSGNSTITVTAIDSRGLKTIKNIGTINVIAYQVPYLSGYKVERLENGIKSPLGDTGSVVGTINIKNVVNNYGANINTPWWEISFQNGTVESSSINASTSVSIEDTKTFTLSFGDKFKRLEIHGTIPTGQAPLILSGKGIGINTVPPSNTGGVYIGGNNNFERSLNFIFENKALQIRSATGYAIGNGVGININLGTDTSFLLLNDGTIWTVDKVGNRIKKIAG